MFSRLFPSRKMEGRQTRCCLLGPELSGLKSFYEYYLAVTFVCLSRIRPLLRPTFCGDCLYCGRGCLYCEPPATIILISNKIELLLNCYVATILIPTKTTTTTWPNKILTSWWGQPRWGQPPLRLLPQIHFPLLLPRMHLPLHSPSSTGSTGQEKAPQS